MTLAQFRTVISAKLGLNTTAGGAEELLVDRWANEGRDRVLLDTHAYVTSQSVTPGAVEDYSLTSSVLAIESLEVESGGTTFELERVSLEEIRRMRRASSTATGATRFYALVGANKLAFWPTPGASDAFEMYYVPRPTDMSSGSHDPSDVTYGGIPAEYHKAIEYYALWQGAEYDENRSSQSGQSFKLSYEQEIRRVRTKIRAKGGQRLNRAQVPPRRRYLTSDPART